MTKQLKVEGYNEKIVKCDENICQAKQGQTIEKKLNIKCQMGQKGNP